MKPLALAEFWDRLPAFTYDWPPLPSASRISETRDGEEYGTERGRRKWAGSVTIGAQYVEDMMEFRAIIGGLSVAGAYFEVAPPWVVPRPELAGAYLSEVSNTGAAARFGGLPPATILRAGDCVTMVSPFGGWWLFQLLSPVMVGGDGQTPVVGLSPSVPGSIEAGTAAFFDQPRLVAQMVPNSVSAGSFQVDRDDGVSFAWRQTFKAVAE
ncbi:MAG: hypothetical protein HWE26_13670 [Alteromonadaceae bacterium]|nr:hypothetical protein [Alteromonadaceae bacterium]